LKIWKAKPIKLRIKNSNRAPGVWAAGSYKNEKIDERWLKLLQLLSISLPLFNFIFLLILFKELSSQLKTFEDIILFFGSGKLMSINEPIILKKIAANIEYFYSLKSNVPNTGPIINARPTLIPSLPKAIVRSDSEPPISWL